MRVKTLFWALILIPTLALGEKQFVNLKVLPADISTDELREVMIEYSTSLGVRCHYCHDGKGKENPYVTEIDYVSESNHRKDITRTMMLMVQSINQTVQATSSDPKNVTEVTCLTCHREQSKPQLIQDVIREKQKSEGIELAMHHYEELRKKHFGSFVYNFKSMPLLELAHHYSSKDMLLEAKLVLQTNLKFNEKDAWSHAVMSDLMLKLGDKASALQSMEIAAKLEPDTAFYQTKLKALKE